MLALRTAPVPPRQDSSLTRVTAPSTSSWTMAPVRSP
jgi:hypothetical protein